MNARIVSFIEGGCRREDAQTTGVYPESINQLGNGTIFLVDCGIEDRLCAVNCPDFSGEAFRAGGQDCVLVPLDHACAENLRRLLPFTAPSPVLREQRTIGLGDRLGIAAPLRPCNARDNSLLGACAAEAQGLRRAPSAVEDKDGGSLYLRGAGHRRCGNGVYFARLNEALRQFQLHFAARKSRDPPRRFAVHGAERDRRGVRLDNSYF